MRILLIRPKPPKYTIGLKNIMVCEPLELEYIAASIYKGHQVEILDMIIENQLEKKLRSFSPDIVGTSSYITGVNIVKQICRTVKNFNRAVITVVGGVHATLCPDDYKDNDVDHIIKGPGFKAFNSIIECLERGKRDRIEFDEETRDYLDIHVEDLPFPNRALIEKYRKKYYYLFHQPVTLIKTTFGCPFRCNFCYCWPLTGGKVYSRKPESVVSELLQIKNKEIYIIDDTFFINKEHVMAIHELIVKYHVNKAYLVYAHADFIINNPDLIKAWSDIGLKACIIGLESPKDSELQNYNKRSTVITNNQAIKILQMNHIDVYASFIIGLEWTRRDFKVLNRYIRENNLFYIVLQPFTPFPGTAVFKDYDNFTIPFNFYELWDMQHAVIKPALPEKAFYKEIRKIYIKTVFNPMRHHVSKHNTMPSVFSLKYLKLLSGALKIYFDLRNAHRHKDLLEKKT